MFTFVLYINNRTMLSTILRQINYDNFKTFIQLIILDFEFSVHKASELM
jgi:hypothetical protein